jgi:ABC-type Fe3+-hydroxamate transport system substrate-binding protein
MQRVFDDRGRVLLFPSPPKRVVSLVPSDTLTVAALGCAGSLVGRTDYCELPTEIVAALPTVGGTKNPKLELLFGLEPDLVLANQEENTKADLEAITNKGIPLYISFPKRVADGIAHIAKLARADTKPSTEPRQVAQPGGRCARSAPYGRRRS